MKYVKKHTGDWFPSGVVQRRFWATEIDFLILEAVVICLAWLTMPELSVQLIVFTQEEFSPADILIAGLFAAGIYMVYVTVAERYYRATVGKRLLGLRVQSANSEPLPIGRYVIRNLLKQIEISSPIIAVFFILNPSRKGKSLGDQFGKTRVVRI